MPPFPILRRSGVHRVACFALSRALLRQIKQLSTPIQRTAREELKAVIRRNAKLQGHKEIAIALKLGYETLDALHNDTRRQHVLKSISELANRRRAENTASITRASYRHGTSRPRLESPKPCISPYPAASKVLDRPFRHLSGRRHVPVLISANRVPMLRLKKPQPPFLSRMIRNLNATREGRTLLAPRLEAEMRIAEDEDTWDRILYTTLGVIDEDGRCWTGAVSYAMEELKWKQDQAIKKRIETAKRMWEIVKKERALAEEEVMKRRREKQRIREERRSVREKEDSVIGGIEAKDVSIAGEKEGAVISAG